MQTAWIRLVRRCLSDRVIAVHEEGAADTDGFLYSRAPVRSGKRANGTASGNVDPEMSIWRGALLKEPWVRLGYSCVIEAVVFREDLLWLCR